MKRRKTNLKRGGNHQSHRAPTWLGMALLFATASSGLGQSFAIDWFTIAGGGATSSGGAYSLTGTIGQWDVGVQGGGDFVLTGGFWSAIPLSDTPSLSLRLSPTNTVIISWPAPSTGFELQQNSEVTTANWSNVGASPTVVGSENQIVLPSPGASRFFRLRKP